MGAFNNYKGVIKLSIPKCYDFENYDNYPTESNPTSNSQMQEYMRNQNALVKQLASMMWQPQTQYTAGQFVFSSALPSGAFAVCVTAGRTGTTEPTWSAIGSNTSDSGVTWSVRKLSPDLNFLPINGGTLTGTTYAPTPATTDNSTKIATTEFVKTQIPTSPFECENTGLANTPISDSRLHARRVTNAEAPNNGVVLQFGNSADWNGQLFIGDNATQGCWWNGWDDGTRGQWLPLLMCTHYSTAQNGYIRLSNGFTIQWGSGKANNSSEQTVTFPTPFSNACLSVVANMGNTTVSGFEHNVYPKNWTKENFVIYNRNSGSGGFTWVAFGY